MPGDISAEVKRFIHRTINSVEQLEILLLLMSHSSRDWSAEEIGERVRLPAETVGSRLEELHVAKLLDRGEKGRYQYAPETAALEEHVAEKLQEAYQERRHAVMELIYSRPLENIRIFADAFRIRRED